MRQTLNIYFLFYNLFLDLRSEKQVLRPQINFIFAMYVLLYKTPAAAWM